MRVRRVRGRSRRGRSRRGRRRRERRGSRRGGSRGRNTGIKDTVEKLLVLDGPGDRVAKHARCEVCQVLAATGVERLGGLAKVVELVLGTGKGGPAGVVELGRHGGQQASRTGGDGQPGGWVEEGDKEEGDAYAGGGIQFPRDPPERGQVDACQQVAIPVLRV